MPDRTVGGVYVERTRDELIRLAASSGIPEHMINSVVAYVYDHRRVGHFLTAVLSNDLTEACNRADEENQHKLYEYVFFFYNYAPRKCWGSRERLEDWIMLRNEAREREREAKA